MILQSIFIKFTIEKMITDYSYFTLYSISTILLNTQNISHIKSKERNIFFIYTLPSTGRNKRLYLIFLY